MVGCVIAVCRADRTGVPKAPVSRATLIAGHGIEGDAHAGPWHRQVSLLAAEQIDEDEVRYWGWLLAKILGDDLVVDDLVVDPHLGVSDLETLQHGERLARHLQLPLALVNEYASSWAAGERHGLHGDRSGALDSAAAALLLEQWLQEGPEPSAVVATPVGGRETGSQAS